MSCDPMPATLGGPVQLVAAKVRAPRPLPFEIRRRQILLRLATPPVPDVVLFVAPGGFGKTTTACQWATSRGLPVAWVVAEPSDRDPVSLLSALLRALPDAVLQRWGAQQITGDEPAFGRHVMPRFAAALGDLGKPITVVLDDVHLALPPDAAPGTPAATVVRVLAEHLPAGSALAMTGRTAPGGLPVARWRADGRLRDVGITDLAFDAAETAELVGAVTPPGSAVADAARLRGDGWPVAVYLQARSPQATGPDDLAEYLDTEVLAEFDPGVAAFLRRTSHLSALSASLCDAVTGDADGQVQLARAQRATRLVTPLAGEGGWVRVHPLVRERLARQHAEHEPTEAPVLAARAAAWFRDAGLPDEAIRQAIASHDESLIAATVWQFGASALLAGQRGRVLTWLGQIQEPVRRRQVELAILHLWAALNGGDGADASRWHPICLELLGADWRRQVPTNEVAQVYAVWWAARGVDGPAASAELAAAAFQAMRPTFAMRPLARCTQGWSQLLADDAAGHDALLDGASLARAQGVAVTAVQALSLAGLLRLLGDDPVGAGAPIHEAEQIWSEAGLAESHSATVFLLEAQACSAAHTGDGSRALELLAKSAAISSAWAPAMEWIVGLDAVVQARCRLQLGDVAAARDQLQRAGNAVGSRYPLLVRLIAQLSHSVAAAGPLATLTAAETRVWELLQTRMTQREIAEQLVVSPETVKSQTAAIYRKLAVSSRRDLQELGERLPWATGGADHGLS